MKTFILAGLFLVAVAVEAKKAIGPPWTWGVKHYPAPAPFAMDVMYWDAVNRGEFDKQLVEDVSFSRNAYLNFGLASPQLRGHLLQVSHPNARNAYSEVNRLTLERSGCPPHFTTMFLRKVNQLRQRHQAGPLHLDENLSQMADSVYDAHRSEPRNVRQQLETLRFSESSNSSDIDTVRLNVDSIVEAFYLPSLKTWRNYGKENVNAEEIMNNRNFLALLNRQGMGVGVFCSVFQTGMNNPVTRVDNVVKITFVFDKFNVNTVTRNVLPPGYFGWNNKEGGSNEGGVERGFENNEPEM